MNFLNKLKLKDFDRAFLKLTLYYVVIVMLISVSFSFVLYRISSSEITRGLGGQARILRDVQIERLYPPLASLEQARLEQIKESTRRLKLNLIYFNLLILGLSSIISFSLARKTLKPIEEAFAAQNRFTADASHELRTPLTAMQTEIEVALRDKKLNLELAKGLLRSNLEEIGKLESLSSALLTLARSEEKVQANFTDVSLEEVIAEAYEKIESLADEKKIVFENDIANLCVRGDQQSLVELFVILLDNAIKYSPNQSKINIIAKQLNNKAIVSIKDQGIGIKDSDLPYIFNRFYRADSSRNKEKVEGFGLGLSIARQIVGLHNGTIIVESRFGQGSKFIISFWSN